MFSNDFLLQIISRSTRLIHSLIQDHTNHISCSPPLFIGILIDIYKTNLISDLLNIKDQHWIIIGNVDELSNPNAKFPISNGNSTGHNRFNSFIQSNNPMILVLWYT